MRSLPLRSENKSLSMPKTVSSSLVQVDNLEKQTVFREKADEEALKGIIGRESHSPAKANDSLLVLARLHACGDLSLTMLAFMECDEVKARLALVVVITYYLKEASRRLIINVVSQ